MKVSRIDTVKQAEIMAEIREKFGLPVDEDFVLADYPTLNQAIDYIHKMKEMIHRFLYQLKLLQKKK